MPLDGSRFELPLPASVVALDKARALLGPNGENWIQGPFALDASGKALGANETEQGCRFCTAGAYLRVGLECDDGGTSMRRILGVAAKEMGFAHEVDLNDRPDTTFPLVDRMWSRAREILMAEAHARETVL